MRKSARITSSVYTTSKKNYHPNSTPIKNYRNNVKKLLNNFCQTISEDL